MNCRTDDLDERLLELLAGFATALRGSVEETTVYMATTGFDGAPNSYEDFLCDYYKITRVMQEVVWRFARMLYPFQMLVFKLDQPLNSGRAGRPGDFPHM